MSRFCCLYDKDFNALGQWTQHVCESWSLKRKAYEQDELELSCKGWENSASACFVGLHSELGALEYLAFCGIPYTKDGMTEVTGIDCRTIFNQTIYVEYASTLTTASDLYRFLLQGAFEQEGVDLGIPYSIDVSDLSLLSRYASEAVERGTREIRNVWDEIQRCNAVYDVFVEAVASADASSGEYVLSFRARRVISTRSIGLRDFDYEAELDSNAANHAIAIGPVTIEDEQGGTSTETWTRHYWLSKDNSVTAIGGLESGTPPDGARFPIITETFHDEEDFYAAQTEARSLLSNNRFQDRVTIDLNGLLGKVLEDLDFTYFGVLFGYNPADPDTAKALPVSAISEDSSGNRSIEFGRLSEYWFLD